MCWICARATLFRREGPCRGLNLAGPQGLWKPWCALTWEIRASDLEKDDFLLSVRMMDLAASLSMKVTFLAALAHASCSFNIIGRVMDLAGFLSMKVTFLAALAHAPCSSNIIGGPVSSAKYGEFKLRLPRLEQGTVRSVEGVLGPQSTSLLRSTQLQLNSTEGVTMSVSKSAHVRARVHPAPIVSGQ